MTKPIDMARILVVDDYATMRRIITSMLRQFGVTDIDHATEGQEALHRMEGEVYDVVLCDWCMEPMSGETFLKEARARHPRVPVVVVSAHGSSSIIDRSTSLGAHGFLHKPFSPDALRRTLAGIVEIPRLQPAGETERAGGGLLAGLLGLKGSSAS